jgi:hypothetical protein
VDEAPAGSNRIESEEVVPVTTRLEKEGLLEEGSTETDGRLHASRLHDDANNDERDYTV